MKKVKILLMSLLVFAVVGGALAFKVKSKFVLSYCTTLARINGGAFFCTDDIGGPLACTIPAFNRKPSDGGTPICTAVMPLDLNCGTNRICINQVTFTIADGGALAE